jgi:hypothetical protein
MRKKSVIYTGQPVTCSILQWEGHAGRWWTEKWMRHFVRNDIRKRNRVEIVEMGKWNVRLSLGIRVWEEGVEVTGWGACLRIGFGTSGVDCKAYSATDWLLKGTESISCDQQPQNSVKNKLLEKLNCMCVESRQPHEPWQVSVRHLGAADSPVRY